MLSQEDVHRPVGDHRLDSLRHVAAGLKYFQPRGQKSYQNKPLSMEGTFLERATGQGNIVSPSELAPFSSPRTFFYRRRETTLCKEVSIATGHESIDTTIHSVG